MVSERDGSMDDGDGYVEVPIFYGVEDPEKWIAWVEAYFVAEGFTEENKMAFTYGFIEEAERLSVQAEIRQTVDESRSLHLMYAQFIASRQMTSHDEQKQLDDNKETNPAKAELLVSRVADTHVEGFVFEEHVEPNLANSDKEDHAHQDVQKYKPRKWEKHKIQSHMLRNLKRQIMGIMKGCKRVKSCGVVLDKLLYNKFYGFKYKDKDLHMDDILQI
ncbi:unnamed protein product [Cochlearia groenlandica]